MWFNLRIKHVYMEFMLKKKKRLYIWSIISEINGTLVIHISLSKSRKQNITQYRKFGIRPLQYVQIIVIIYELGV